jgi:hypothetical protein
MNYKSHTYIYFRVSFYWKKVLGSRLWFELNKQSLFLPNMVVGVVALFALPQEAL